MRMHEVLSQRYSAARILLDFLHGCKHTSRDRAQTYLGLLGLLVKQNPGLRVKRVTPVRAN